MKHVLNIDNSLNTYGNWHKTAIYWEDNYIDFKDTENSLLGGEVMYV